MTSHSHTPFGKRCLGWRVRGWVQDTVMEEVEHTLMAILVHRKCQAPAAVVVGIAVVAGARVVTGVATHSSKG